MAVFFALITAPTSYNTTPDVSLPDNWQPKRIEIVNEDQTAANDAFISFDGTTDAGHVIGGTDALAATITYHAQAGVRKIWFKKGGGSAPKLRVLVEQ